MMKNNRRNDVLKLINLISETKNLDKEVVISFLLNSIKKIINSQLDPDAQITLEVVNDELVLTNLNKLVISDDEEYKNDSRVVDIHLSEALEINPNVKINDTIAAPIHFDDFTRSTYSKIEQSFRMEIVNWERKRVYEKYQPLIGTELEAKFEEDFGAGRGATFILEDGTLCYMPAKYQNSSINLNDKKFHKVTIEEVYELSKNYQVLVSNDSPNKVRELLKNEVPEIDNGLIQIVGISRIKGERAKISFRKNPNITDEIDVVGSIIGPQGSRINNVCRMFGEKIDVIIYSDDIYEYISNALSPARVVSINKKANGKDYLVVVPDKHNTLAIGKKGANVKLTVELIRVNIDICSYSYAIENKIPIHWNGNVANEEELQKIEQSENLSNNRFKNNRVSNYRKPSRNNSFIVNIDEFEREVAEYNEEISSYEPIDYSVFNFENKNDDEQYDIDADFDLYSNNENNNIETKKQPVNKNEIKKANDNFKFDSDIAGDVDISNIDFSDFDDEF